MYRRDYRWLLMLVPLTALFGCLPVDPETAPANQLFHNRKVVTLVQAAERGDVTTMDRLVNEGIDVNARGRGGATPLLRALLARNRQGYVALLQHGADPNQQTVRGDTVTHIAAEASDSFWLRQALKYGANPNSMNTGHPHRPGCTPIFYAIFKERTENVQVLIDAGANLDHVDEYGFTPLYVASEHGAYDIVYALLKGGADVHLETEERSSIIDDFLRRKNEGSVMDKTQRPWFRKVIAFLKEQGVDL